MPWVLLRTMVCKGRSRNVVNPDICHCLIRQVYKAMKDGVSPVAVKVFPSNASQVQMEDFQREVIILKSCRDRNIVQVQHAPTSTHRHTVLQPMILLGLAASFITARIVCA